MPNFRYKLRIFWITLLLATVFWLAWQFIIPSGKTIYIKDFKHYNDFIGNLTPAERMSGNKIIGDPVYFSLRVPRRFESAKVSVKFKNPNNLPLIEAGVLTDKRVWQYNLLPLENKVLDGLLKNWSVIWDEDVMLLQKEKKYNYLKDFLISSTSPSEVAAYNYDWRTDFILPNYQPAKEPYAMCRPLLGAYKFYTYIKNEDLSFDFSFDDLNKNNDSDPVDVLVYYRDQQIAEEHLADDDSSNRNLKLFLADLPEGVYKISVRANNDIITRTITTPQSKLSFINNLNLAKVPEVSCGRNFVTDSHNLQAKTVYAESLGTINILPFYKVESASAISDAVLPLYKRELGGVVSDKSNNNFYKNLELALTETYKQFETKDVLPDLSSVIVPADGISFSGDGLFSFSETEFFNPQVKKIDRYLNPEKINFAIARYTPPLKQGDWLLSEANFDLTNVYKENGKHSFMISALGLKADDEIDDGVEIGEIKIELNGVSLWKKVKKMINDK